MSLGLSDAELLNLISEELHQRGVSTSRVGAAPPQTQPSHPLSQPLPGVSSSSNLSSVVSPLSFDSASALPSAPGALSLTEEAPASASAPVVAAGAPPLGGDGVSQPVTVTIRIRPILESDVETASTPADCHPCIEQRPERPGVVFCYRAYEGKDIFFPPPHTVLSPMASQQEAYDAIKGDVVRGVLAGYNGTILAYGQTGSGKTHTMFGPAVDWDCVRSCSDAVHHLGIPRPTGILAPTPDEDGALPRAVTEIFAHIAATPSVRWSVALSAVQIYNEALQDLVDPSRCALQIREDPRAGVYVEGLSQIAVQTENDLLDLLRICAQHRHVSSTRKNRFSSRSHAIVLLAVHHDAPAWDGSGVPPWLAADAPPSSYPTRPTPPTIRRGVLSFVDLAGSERVARSGSAGARLVEAKLINRSLAALGNCISAVVDSQSGKFTGTRHIPFRDSKLTRLLTDSLGGNARTSFVATVSPTAINYDETVSTLLFASRAVLVRNKVFVNEISSIPGSASIVPDSSGATEALKITNNELITQLQSMGSVMRSLLEENARLAAAVKGQDAVPMPGTATTVENSPSASRHGAPMARSAQDGFCRPADSSERRPGDNSGRPLQPLCPNGMSGTDSRPSLDGGARRMCGSCQAIWATKEAELFEKFAGVVSHLQSELSSERAQTEKLATERAEAAVRDTLAALGINPHGDDGYFEPSVDTPHSLSQSPFSPESAESVEQAFLKGVIKSTR